MKQSILKCVALQKLMPPWTRTHDLHVEQWSCKSCHIFQIDHIGLFFYSLTACPNFDRVELNCFDSMLFCCCWLERCCSIIRLTFSGFFQRFWRSLDRLVRYHHRRSNRRRITKSSHGMNNSALRSTDTTKTVPK